MLTSQNERGEGQLALHEIAGLARHDLVGNVAFATGRYRYDMVLGRRCVRHCLTAVETKPMLLGVQKVLVARH